MEDLVEGARLPFEHFEHSEQPSDGSTAVPVAAVDSGLEATRGEDDPAPDVASGAATDNSLEDYVLISEVVSDPAPSGEFGTSLKAVIEAAIYITDDPLAAEQIAAAIGHPLAVVKAILDQLVTEYAGPDRGIAIREIAGGYKMTTKPEHHEAIRTFVKHLQPALKLSLAALETLAVVAYKQPITGPEIMDIRGVQGLGVLKTLLDRKLIATAGRKNVLGKPMQYKTTREFLIQFGLSSLSELPTLKEFEELGRLALSDSQDVDLVHPPLRSPAESPSRETAAVDAENALIVEYETGSPDA